MPEDSHDIYIFDSIVPVILAGGKGTRLRPLTSQNRPKALVRPLNHQSLLAATLERARPFAPGIITCSERHEEKIIREAERSGTPLRAVLAEPSDQGTAPALCAAAHNCLNDAEMMLVMPSDHFIEDTSVLLDAIKYASEIIRSGMSSCAILGVKPAHWSSRFGYIRADSPVKNDVFGFDTHLKACRVKRFIEKPPPSVLSDIRTEPHIYWNSGIFLMRPHVFLNEMSLHEPALHDTVFEAYNKRQTSYTTPERQHIFALHDRSYAKLLPLSVDHAVMEKQKNAVVVPLETRWHDLGCWPDLLSVIINSKWSRSRKSA